MLSAYVSQPDAGDFVKASFELYRPQPAYDFSNPPHAGLLNYEVWQWAITGEEVCASYRNCLPHLGGGTSNQEPHPHEELAA
jgi:N-acetylglucosamine malate deacetylase 2